MAILSSIDSIDCGVYHTQNGPLKKKVSCQLGRSYGSLGGQ